MNFGGKIVILYLGFVALIVTLVVMCFKQDVELVSADYYDQEIKFQDKIEACNNEKQLLKSIQHDISEEAIVLRIDSALLTKDFTGTIILFRPSDSKMDKEYKMAFRNNEQKIDSRELAHGAYKLQLSWVSNQKHYFKEDVIFIN
jgi:hypothetical protein